jgi:hypothetical protein
MESSNLNLISLKFTSFSSSSLWFESVNLRFRSSIPKYSLKRSSTHSTVPISYSNKKFKESLAKSWISFKFAGLRRNKANISIRIRTLTKFIIWISKSLQNSTLVFKKSQNMLCSSFTSKFASNTQLYSINFKFIQILRIPLLSIWYLAWWSSTLLQTKVLLFTKTSIKTCAFHTLTHLTFKKINLPN